MCHEGKRTQARDARLPDIDRWKGPIRALLIRKPLQPAVDRYIDAPPFFARQNTGLRVVEIAFRSNLLGFAYRVWFLCRQLAALCKEQYDSNLSQAVVHFTHCGSRLKRNFHR
jgi:hypothetical protein